MEGGALTRARQGEPNIVWRIDAAVQRATRDSSLQQARPLQAIASGANWWGGDGVVWTAAFLWLGARAIGRRGVARVGLRAAEALAVASAISGIVTVVGGKSS